MEKEAVCEQVCGNLVRSELFRANGPKGQFVGEIESTVQRLLRHKNKRIYNNQVFYNRWKGIRSCESKITHGFNFNCTTVSIWCVCGNISTG